MIVHLFPKSKFAEPFIEFLIQNFDMREHEILLYENGPYVFSNRWFEKMGIFDMDIQNYRWLYSKLACADKIIFHNLSVKPDILLFLSLHKSILKKSMWLIWGSDLYCFRDKRKGIASRVVESLRKRIIQTIPVIITWIIEDWRLANLWYRTSSVHMPVAYYDEELVNVLSKMNQKTKKQTYTIRILLGNSATKTNNHVEMLEFLKKWAEEDIEIYAPLSYGDSFYADEIQSIGESYFGKKFKAIRTYLSRQQYFNLLNEMDIAIFNHDRQQALGNIVALLYLEKKIYLRNNTTMWKTLVDDMGFGIFTIEDLKSSKLDELKGMDTEIKEENRRIAKGHYDLKKRIKEWEDVFSYDMNLQL